VRMRRNVKGLRALDVQIDVVVTSPLVRAAQTADILARGLEKRPKLVTSETLAPDGTPARVAEALAAYGKTRAVAVVGHEPGLGELAAWLIGARQPLPFRKGGVCRIDFTSWPPSAKQGILVWFATPKILTKIR
jgi:phosphohistidine phosphatase